MDRAVQLSLAESAVEGAFDGSNRLLKKSTEKSLVFLLFA